MKTFWKSNKRMFGKHFTKMISISFIILISIGLIAGVAASPSKVNDSVTEYYQEQNVADFLVKSMRTTGFTEEEIEAIKDQYGEENVMGVTSFDLDEDGEVTRYHYLDFDHVSVNKLEILEGNYPENEKQVLVERATSKLKEYQVGDTIVYNEVTYTISGVVKNPYYFQKLEEPSYLEDKDLTRIVYLDKNIYLPITDLYISLEDKTKLENMGDTYETLIEKEKKQLEGDLEEVTILSLYENVSFYKVFTITEKINVISLVLLIGFICVSALVVLSTMSRLIEEERKVIGCLKTLGYSNLAVILRYVLFAFFSTILGGVLAYFVGEFLTIVIYYNFDAMYAMPDMTDKVVTSYYFLTLFILVISTLCVACYTSYRITKVMPAYIFKKKAPKVGKKTLLEKIPFCGTICLLSISLVFEIYFVIKSIFS